MAGFDLDRLVIVFGADVAHDEAKASATLTHDFGDEDFLRGHFPGLPVVPGVILLDGMILAASHAFVRLTGRKADDIHGIAVGNAAFSRPVVPGMRASFTARADASGQAGHGFSAKCAVMIEGTRHARASMSFCIHGDQTSPAT
jgi:3-hydroxymyristoyl/3-hydroxydecanoyl-(acyl carrier protein) dehydratase